MSYTYLQEQGEESLAESFSDIAQYVRLKLIPTLAECFCNGNEMESCRGSQSGMMSPASTEQPGEESRMSSAVDSRAKTSQLAEKDLESKANEAGSGSKWRELSVKWDRASSSWKTHRCLWEEDLDWSSVTWPRWGMMRDGEVLELTTPVLPCKETDSGWWPRPRARDWKDTGNPAKVAALRHQDATLPRVFAARLGQIPPVQFAEWLMGWPIEWSGLTPLETDKFQQWLDSHGISSRETTI